MSMTIDNKTFRNLEEQVLKNKEDIAKHYEIDRVLADWGIKVIGVVATINDIPEGNYEYGDSYGLSSTSPMQYVIWTRANPNVGQDTDYWLNVGALSLVGPQGAQGIQGIQGIQGVRGSKWTSSTSAPTATSGYNMGDQWLNTTTGDVYEFRGNTWARLGNIKGPQGVQGPIGPKGDQGIQGPTGSQGPKGDTGSSFTIAGLLNNAENLPTPTEANRHKGYAVKNADNVTYDLYVVVGEAGSLQWVNMGRVEGVEGPQGPVGPQGPAGADIQIVHITGIPSTATQGNLTQDQVNTLLAHPGNYIQFFNENFYPQDVEIGEGYIVYSHVGQIGSETKIKNINLTIATGGWVLTETSLVSAPISIVNELPEANEENFEKGKIYTTGELLQYISKVALSEPNINIPQYLTNANWSMCSASVGNNVYIFGGLKSKRAIFKFDTTNNSITQLSTTFPIDITKSTAQAYGTNIYIFVNSNKSIYKFNTVDTSLIELSTKLTYTPSSSAIIGSKIYVYSSAGSSCAISIFNILNESVFTTTYNLGHQNTNARVAAVDNNVYIFGGDNGGSTFYDTIIKFDTNNNSFSTLSAKLPFVLSSMTCLTFGSMVYVYGGGNPRRNTIIVFNALNESVNTLSITLPNPNTDSTGSVVGNSHYIIGGYGDDGLSTIVKAEFGFTFQYKTIQTQ